MKERQNVVFSLAFSGIEPKWAKSVTTGGFFLNYMGGTSTMSYLIYAGNKVIRLVQLTIM